MFLPTDYLSTGSTLLNLACTGDPRRGFAKGLYFFIVGDSASGKTFLSLTCLAEAARNPSFKNYRFIFDDVEGGALMEIERYFGKKLANRLEPPHKEDGCPVFSQTIEDFYFHLDDALQDKKPCIYILDSMDALTSEYEADKFVERKKASRGGPKAKGSYGDGKAKWNSNTLRGKLAEVRDTGSILIIINQTRDNIDAGMFEPAKTRSGGHALTFYATLEIWSAVGAKIKKSVKGKDRVVGVKARVTVKKNRFTGRQRTLDVPIYYSYGIDDVGSCIDYLVNEGYWKRTKQGVITVTGLGPEFHGRLNDVADFIDDGDLYDDLIELMKKAWDEIETKCELGRRPRYV